MTNWIVKNSAKNSKVLQKDSFYLSIENLKKGGKTKVIDYFANPEKYKSTQGNRSEL